MKSQVANPTLADAMDDRTVVGDPSLWHLEGDRIRCLACGHRCLIGEDKRGICKVRYNEGGQLKVPFGYVAGLQCDPVEKKPFFHVYPSSDALTFGMLGCDLHCSYCFPGETLVVTSQGPMSLAQAFNSAPQVEAAGDARIAYPEDLFAVAGSGTRRRVRAVFKHHYAGRLAELCLDGFPEVRCTPDHRIYATLDATCPPEPIAAQDLTDHHYLAIPASVYPRALSFACRSAAGLDSAIQTGHYCLVRLRELRFVAYRGDVYNMEVEEEHNYLAGFFLVSNCQNWVTSQALRDSAAVAPLRPITPGQLVDIAQREHARLVVSSYNEPLITAEWAVAVFREATAAGFSCAFVSNGNATPEVLDFLRPWIVSYKVDLKSFDDAHYRTLGGTLQNITDTIRMVHERGIWLEVVTLVIPGFNDSEAELRQAARFLASVSPDIPWHVTAFHKDYRMTDPDGTPASTLIRAAEIGTEEGLHFIYAGNLPGRVGPWENTRCPTCRETLIERYGYLIRSYRLTPDGRCPRCRTALPGIWPGSLTEVRTGNDMAAYARRLPRPVATPAVHTPRGRGQPLPLVDSPGPQPLQGTESMTTAIAPAAERPDTRPALTTEQKEQILAATRDLLRATVAGVRATFPDDALLEVRDLVLSGAFVSLKRGKHLRSCCGMLGRPVPLARAIQEAGSRTIWEDSRFPPVSPSELDHLEIEVWLLHSPEPVAAKGEERLQAITIGKHGIQVARGQAHGLFLPSVAVDHGWDTRRYLDQVCLKAGLHASAWREEDTSLHVFEGEVLRGRMMVVATSGDLAATTGDLPPATGNGRRSAVCRPEDLPAYANFCRGNMEALLRGMTPSYYFFGAADGQVNGAVLTLGQPGNAQVMQLSQISLRPGLPLQATLFALSQSVAQSLAAQRVPAEALAGLQVGLTLLHDPVLHGTVAEPELHGFDPRHRALLVMERGKSALVYDPQKSPDELLRLAAERARVGQPATAGLFSLEALSTVVPLVAANVPQAVRGAATRPAGVAGRFYPADPAELARLVDQLLGASERRPEEWAAAMVPHAGLVYSGQLAARVLNRLKIPRTVIVIGPKHTLHGVEWAVAPHQTWEVPGGTLESDFMLARQLAEAIPGLEMDSIAHRQEHAIEVELPLLARLAPETRVVGIAIGAGDLDSCRRFAEGLARVLRERKDRPLLLVSSDMNHFATDAENRRLDAIALDALERLDPEDVYETVTENHISMCGVLPAVMVMETLRLLGGLKKAERVGYATSADVTGDTSRVVGYAGMLIR